MLQQQFKKKFVTFAIISAIIAIFLLKNRKKNIFNNKIIQKYYKVQQHVAATIFIKFSYILLQF